MSKESARIRRSKKLRAKLQKVELMRISISRSLKNITAQLIDSSNGKVLATVSTQQKALKSKNGGNIEAASKGLPCVVSNSGGTPESIHNNGIIVSENNIEELIDAILQVVKNLPKLSKKSLTFAKKFKSSSKINEYLNCI